MRNPLRQSLPFKKTIDREAQDGRLPQTEMMERDPENHKRWKFKMRWHNRGNVWDKNCDGLGR